MDLLLFSSCRDCPVYAILTGLLTLKFLRAISCYSVIFEVWCKPEVTQGSLWGFIAVLLRVASARFAPF